MKIAIILYTILFNAQLCFGQYPSDLQNGAYTDITQIMNNSPVNEFSFDIKKRSITNIQLVGGNDYKVTSNNSNISQFYIDSKVLAIYDGDTLFVNGSFVNGYKHYCKIENNGRYLILKAGIPTLAKRKKQGFKMAMTNYSYIPLGGAIGGAANGAQLAMIRLYYILDSQNGSIRLLTENYLDEIIPEDTNLRKDLNAEKDILNQNVLIKYIQKLNCE
jgi:hypothetical protein